MHTVPKNCGVRHVPTSTILHEDLTERRTYESFFSDFARLFRPSVLKGLSRSGKSEFISSVLLESGLLADETQGVTYADAFELVYQILKSEYRCEYVFKNAIAQQLFMEKHDLAESRIYYELRCGGRIADAIVVNGESTLYEIKTGLDKLDRLANQLDTFSRVFDRVYVVTEYSRSQEMREAIPEGIGLIDMSEDGDLSEIVASDSHINRFDPSLAFDTLRQTEYLAAIEKAGYEIPTVPTWLLYDECRSVFCGLDPTTAYSLFLNALRTRDTASIQIDALEKIPPSVSALVLNTRFSQNEQLSLPNVLASGTI